MHLGQNNKEGQAKKDYWTNFSCNLATEVQAAAQQGGCMTEQARRQVTL